MVSDSHAMCTRPKIVGWPQETLRRQLGGRGSIPGSDILHSRNLFARPILSAKDTYYATKIDVRCVVFSILVRVLFVTDALGVLPSRALLGHADVTFSSV